MTSKSNSLMNQFKTSTQDANDGVWFDYPDAANEDGSIPSFRMARKTGQNKAYSAAMRKFTKDHTDDDGKPLDMTPEVEDLADLNIFLAGLMQDWRNFQPSADGKCLEYNEANARTVFGDPDWADLYKDLVIKCSKSTAYKAGQRKADAKKS